MLTPVPADAADIDRVLVLADPPHAIDLLRLATLRSDDVLFVNAAIAPEAWNFARRYAIDLAQRPFAPGDLIGTTAILVALGSPEAENHIVRAARRGRVPLHVVGRPLVSDFSVLAMLERPGRSLAAA